MVLESEEGGPGFAVILQIVGKSIGKFYTYFHLYGK